MSSLYRSHQKGAVLIHGKGLDQSLWRNIIAIKRTLSHKVFVNEDSLLPGQQGRAELPLWGTEVELDLRKAEADENQDSRDKNLHQETFPVSA
jgi:hypothetical protein